MKRRSLYVALFLSSATVAAHADNWGCEVLLCLANPNGPTAVKECVPPISKLWKHLAKGHAFPSCVLAQGPSGASYARQGHSYYDPCPEGTTALAEGAYAIQGTATPQFSYAQQYSGQLYTGIGDGAGLQAGYGPDASPLPGKVCVARRVGAATITRGTGDSQEQYTADVFDRVVVMDPQGSPRIIDVFVDDKLYRRVRW